MHRVPDPAEPIAAGIGFADWLRVDIRVGTVIAAETFPQGRKPAYILTIDFGAAVGVRRSSAQVTEHYTPETLIGRQVVAVVNFPPRQIGPMMSEVLCLGFPDADGKVVLVGPSEPVPNGCSERGTAKDHKGHMVAVVFATAWVTGEDTGLKSLTRLDAEFLHCTLNDGGWIGSSHS